MTLNEIEILIWAAEHQLAVIGKKFYDELVECLKKAERGDLLQRLLAIKPCVEE